MMNYKPGTTVGRYTLELLIGKGAAGEVWKAGDGERMVAIKFMNPNLIESDSAAKHRVRMQREVNALESLHHPNIPMLYAADLDAAPPYLVMTYIEGETYDKLLANGTMLQVPLVQRLRNITALASALDTVHAAGIIHRDIKPANMLGIEHAYLIDFGLAIKHLNLNETMRQVGTLLYMSPEDFTADPSSDTYSFAIVVYELLFGGHPIFRAEDNTMGASLYIRTLAGERIARGEWHLPSHIPADEVPYDLRQSDLTKLDYVFNKAFSTPEARYVEMLTFVAELEAAIKIPQDGVVNQPGSRTIRDMPTQLETPTATMHIPAGALKSAPVSPLEAPVAPYTPPKRVQDQFTILEAEKEQAPTGSRQRIYWIAAVIVIVVIEVVIFLLTRPG